jgi:heptosyltransferase-2
MTSPSASNPAPGAALIVQTAFLGDVILTTPLIASLSQAGPVDVVTTPLGAQVLAHNPRIRETIVFDKRGRDSGPLGLLSMAFALRARGYRRALHAQASMRSSALTRLAGIPERVGFTTAAGRAFYTERVPTADGPHHVQKLLSLAGIGPTGTPPRPELFPSAADGAVIDSLLEASAAKRETLVALAPGSVWATKRWPGYAELAAALVAGDVARPVIIGSDADSPLASEIVAMSQGRAIDATGRLTLLQSAELLRRTRALVTNDSAPLHLASAMNTPTIAVFGPTVPEFGFGPLAERSVVAGVTGLACRPCDRHGPMKCPLGHWRCMRDLSAAEVLLLVHGLLGSRAGS